MRTINIILPDHTSAKIDKLSEYYAIPADMVIQKVVVDRLDDMMEAVILEPARKAKADS